MSTTIKIPGTNRLIVVAILFLIFFLPLITGCSMFSSVERKANRMVRNLRAPDSDLKKRVGIAPLENKTAFKDTELGPNFLTDLTETINASCPDFLLEKPGDPDYPEYLAKLPRNPSGYIDNFDLAKAGRRLGLNIIVTVVLNDVRHIQKKQGVLWFKDIHHYIQVQMTSEVYDTETGAKLLDESFIHEMEIDESDLESTGADSEIRAYIQNDALRHIADSMAEKICNAVVLHPWRGYIISINKNHITISSGKRVGIMPGDIFEVYNSIDTFQGAEGHRFFIPGLKTGEIKISAVYPDTAEAVRISGQDIQVGYSIRPKD